MGYEIVTAKSINDLVEKVNLLMTQGWITQGGVVYSSKERFYLQTMITTVIFEQEDNREEESNNPREVRRFSVAISPDDQEYVAKEWEPAFWEVVSKEFSKEAMLFIARNHILSVRDLIDEMKTRWFRDDAGEIVLDEINGFIKKYGWV